MLLSSANKSHDVELPLLRCKLLCSMGKSVCCLGFSGVIFLAVWAGACFIFCCLGGGADPAQTAKKKKKRPKSPNSPKKNDPPLSERAVVFAVWACFFCCLGGCLFFLCCLGRGRVVFAVWAGCCFLLFGPGACYLFCCLGGGLFFAVWAGDGSSLTYRSAWLVFKRPNNKKDQIAKTKHGFLAACGVLQHDETEKECSRRLWTTARAGTPGRGFEASPGKKEARNLADEKQYPEPPSPNVAQTENRRKHSDVDLESVPPSSQTTRLLRRSF